MKHRMEMILRILFPLFTLVYFVWRIGWTIPTDHGVLSVVFSLILLLCELVGAFEMLVYFRTACGEDGKPPLPDYRPGELPEVDVFVPTLGEPVELLEKTLRGCLSMEYDDLKKIHIYVCDDAGREEVRALAKALGVGYFSRPEHTGAKAGNLNYAMERSNSPLVTVFDADMCPEPQFLLSTVPYFLAGYGKKGIRLLSGKLGFVQTPQSFRNPDLFQRAFRAEELIPNEQDYFYLSLEPGRNRTHSVIFGGSNTVLSRRALEQAGGFSVNSITEDFATGIEIQKLGYDAIAISEPLARGLAPESLSSLIKQRARWARGCIQAGRCTRLLRTRGLSFLQRVSYIASISYWYAPLKRLVYLLSPILYAVFGVTVLRCGFLQMLIFWLPMYLCCVLGIRLLSDGIRTAKWSAIYEISLAPFLLLPVLAESFGIRKREFAVTDKSGRSGWRWWYPLPFLVLIVLSAVGIVRVVGMTLEQSTSVYLLLLFWLVYNLYQLLFALFFVCGCKKLPPEKKTLSLAHDLSRDRLGRTSLFVIIIRSFSEKRKEVCK
ncbi:glycosyltransferase [Agathobaculum hominis]